MKSVKLDTLFVLFGPTHTRHPSGCLASLFEHPTCCGMSCQLLKFICSYLQLTCDAVKTGPQIFLAATMTRCLDPLCKMDCEIDPQHVFGICKSHIVGCILLLQEEISSDKEHLELNLKKIVLVLLSFSSVCACGKKKKKKELCDG